jgi:hypothetical protein
VKAFAHALSLAVVCYSLAQLRDAECKIYCRTSAGYDSGMWIVKQSACWCGDYMSQTRMSEKKIMAPKKLTKAKKSFFTVPMSVTSDDFKLPWE